MNTCMLLRRRSAAAPTTKVCCPSCLQAASLPRDRFTLAHVLHLSVCTPSLVCRAQEELEAKLEKYSVRRGPLGTDRHHRCYWWGLAGHRSVVWVEDAEVSNACMSSMHASNQHATKEQFCQRESSQQGEQ